MKHLTIFRYSFAISLLTFAVLGCASRFISTLPAQETQQDNTSTDKLIRVEPLPVAQEYKNFWTSELEAGFWQRANEVIPYFAGEGYGNTTGENEKRSYPYAMFDFLAGNREKALELLQSADAQASDNQHTNGIDYYYSFTLKGQIRKYFFFGKFLDPAYKKQMFEGAKKWTEKDPLNRPHPIYGNGDDSGDGWGPNVRGGWVDGRNTDNLRAMREVAVYLMAEETGNEETRRLYKQKLQRYVWALYNIGMGEWDSETYHGHTFAAYLNLYDFAKDPEVKKLGKAALDWLSAAAAVKYYRGGFGGPNKRDQGPSNVVYGADAARMFWLYFGDVTSPNPEPERDLIHAITSAYRPPLAVVALARKQFEKPVELLATKPIYENWKPGGEDRPAYWETTFFGHTYQMGSIAGEFGDGDVAPFKLMAYNSQRGVDYFVANTGGDRVRPGKNPGDQIGQYRNGLLWLRPASDNSFFFQLPKTAKAEIEEGIWFFELEKTWLAVHPINLSFYVNVDIPDEKFAKFYSQEQTLKAITPRSGYAGFALEVGEPQSHGSYEAFKEAVKAKSQLDLSDSSTGTVQFTGAMGNRLKLTHNSPNELPRLTRNGVEHDWFNHFELYKPSDGKAPISLGWKTGTLRVEAEGSTFEATVGEDRKARFAPNTGR
ncbi:MULTISPECIES: hypothetical protein [unclassified Coleofasciculus]|uniref:hypothetical protein n=1 Tax=unclassified Coleofasciculus TaxID=2692782 RepID=UPI00187F48F1|nr:MULTISPECIES: hypothetical protein [unclassified Coleofasciculus]MBE9127790.1 hypothetical protein [Coleofasciculus sp. LEGE 07081]MBE9148576.1 hypothetical protein [Coleofasciculus sp. LEGE 07092]